MTDQRSPRMGKVILPDHADCACGYCQCALEHYEARKLAEAERDEKHRQLEAMHTWGSEWKAKYHAENLSWTNLYDEHQKLRADLVEIKAWAEGPDDADRACAEITTISSRWIPSGDGGIRGEA